MKSYVLNLAGSGEISEIYADHDHVAIGRAIEMLAQYPNLFIAKQWDSDGNNDHDEPCKRILFWDNEQSAENDDGARAIAQLSTVGSA